MAAPWPPLAALWPGLLEAQLSGAQLLRLQAPRPALRQLQLLLLPLSPGLAVALRRSVSHAWRHHAACVA